MPLLRCADYNFCNSQRVVCKLQDCEDWIAILHTGLLFSYHRIVSERMFWEKLAAAQYIHTPFITRRKSLG